jgi:hypothetical protein
MTNSFLQEIACPKCLNPIDVRQHGRFVRCEACNSQFILEGHVCPSCFNYHRQEQAFCGRCGGTITRVCRKCHVANWAGDEYCKQCGTALDIFEVLHSHTTQATAERLQQQMDSARHLKEVEAESSRRRMAEFAALEEERLAELRRLQQKQKKEERLMLVITFGAVAVFILMTVLYVLFRMLTTV